MTADFLFEDANVAVDFSTKNELLQPTATHYSDCDD